MENWTQSVEGDAGRILVWEAIEWILPRAGWKDDNRRPGGGAWAGCLSNSESQGISVRNLK